ncbi:hypothetical protein [Sphingobium lignivorans]|uniref:Uncharacterized protein n=1 Tax=Sphingobium lignivorans TaxID=2735886 RepID=A0ABR6NB54_9SPHN|nr:hypothetical protein [Sphingobium lignivorans]MBB5984498.1 hypothetical protein [Sphingobium lignivorans]
MKDAAYSTRCWVTVRPVARKVKPLSSMVTLGPLAQSPRGA